MLKIRLKNGWSVITESGLSMHQPINAYSLKIYYYSMLMIKLGVLGFWGFGVLGFWYLTHCDSIPKVLKKVGSWL